MVCFIPFELSDKNWDVKSLLTSVTDATNVDRIEFGLFEYIIFLLCPLDAVSFVSSTYTYG